MHDPFFFSQDLQLLSIPLAKKHDVMLDYKIGQKILHKMMKRVGKSMPVQLLSNPMGKGQKGARQAQTPSLRTRRDAGLQDRPKDHPQNHEAIRQVQACTAPLKPHGQGAERSESGSDATHYFTFFDQI